MCERLYRAQLERGGDLACPALFVHVPNLVHASVAEQVADLGRLVRTLVLG